MRPVRALLLFTLVICLGAALLAPWAWALAQRLAEMFPDSPALAALAKFPFHDFVRRLLLALALLGSWPLLRSLGARSAADLGLVEPKGQWPRLTAGFALGFGTLACAAIIVLLGGGRKFRADFTLFSCLKNLVSAGAAAATIALIEEIFFRGAIFGALRKAHAWPVALLASSVIYSLLHFLQAPAATLAVHWFSGLVVLPQMLAGLVHARTLLPEFLTLILSGAILGLAYQRTGNLYFSIGLHAGWVCWMKFYASVTVGLRITDHSWLWGSRKLTDSWLALAMLLLTLCLLPRLARGWKNDPPIHAA